MVTFAYQGGSDDDRAAGDSEDGHHDRAPVVEER
jgi:hypothetical protein